MDRRILVVFYSVLFLLPIVISAIFFPTGSNVFQEIAFAAVSFIGVCGMLYTISTMAPRYLTAYYRPKPSQHFCPSCNFPYASVRNEACMNCGASLRLESIL